MKKILIAIVLVISHQFLVAQDEESPKDTSWKTIYRGTYPKINDLVHTKLDVKFDYDKAWMYGKAWITLHPHFYTTDSLTLDAKGMEIKEVSMMKGASKTPLKFVNAPPTMIESSVTTSASIGESAPVGAKSESSIPFA